MKSQATRCTQAQLAYLEYWQARGHTFPRDAVIPESPLTPPNTWALPSRTVLAVTAVMLAVVGVILWLNQ